MKKSPVYIGIGLLAAAIIVVGVVLLGGRSSLSGVEVDWRLLGEFDYITGKIPSELSELNGKSVRIPGFMVPLEDDQRKVVEFLLVPSAQACIHVPPPPPNQMVFVKMKGGADVAMGPIWVYGKLNLMTKSSMYGDASFELEAEAIEPYK